MFIRKAVYEELLNRIAGLEKQVKGAKKAYSDAVYDVTDKAAEDIEKRFRVIQDYIYEESSRNDDRIDRVIGDKFGKLESKFGKLESELDSKIEKAINDLNIEDKVLLKVVKATFNNWEEK